MTPDQGTERGVTAVSPIRLWVMRAMYLVMAVGIGLTIWPLIVSHDPQLPRMTGVAFALLGTIGCCHCSAFAIRCRCSRCCCSS